MFTVFLRNTAWKLLEIKTIPKSYSNLWNRRYSCTAFSDSSATQHVLWNLTAWYSHIYIHTDITHRICHPFGGGATNLSLIRFLKPHLFHSSCLGFKLDNGPGVLLYFDAIFLLLTEVSENQVVVYFTNVKQVLEKEFWTMPRSIEAQ